jgi:hypothetical protein
MARPDIEDRNESCADELVDVGYESDIPPPRGSNSGNLDGKEHGVNHHQNRRTDQTELHNLEWALVTHNIENMMPANSSDADLPDPIPVPAPKPTAIDLVEQEAACAEAAGEGEQVVDCAAVPDEWEQIEDCAAVADE